MIVSFYVDLRLPLSFYTGNVCMCKIELLLVCTNKCITGSLTPTTKLQLFQTHRFFPPVPCCVFTNISPPPFPLLIPLTYPLSQSDKDQVLFLLKKKRTKVEWSYLVGVFYSLLKNKRFQKLGMLSPLVV